MFNKLPTLMITQERSRTQCNDSGFNFGNCLRNRALLQDGFKPPQAYSNGTSVVGLLYKGGVILGTDTRTTKGHVVGFERTNKIFRLHDFIYAGGSGVAQDLQQMANVASSQLDLLTMNNNRHRPRVCGANRLMKQYLYRFRTMINAHFIIAGVDVSGAHLFCTHSDGSSETVPYTVLGSGTMPAISIIESRWEPAMGEFFARDLVCDAVAAGIVSDINSGATIKLCIIRTDFTRQLCSQEVYIKAVDKPRPIALVGLVGPPQMAYIEEVYKKVYPVTSLPSRMNLLQRRSSLDLSLQTAIFSESEEDQQDKQDPTEAEEDQQGHEDQQGSLDLEVSLLEAGADQEDNDDGAPPTKRAKF
ncbi:proteasome subunit beta type-7-like isoform X1 [Drosophila willistoni]|uniref:proteasome subunit beta type-7-like isoform X1 n=1 Tax=Drosophila willistoni TaxID=7260 RepID=UPI00017D9A0C|nr:proteasome subunit beta type-7-like isoform X1 [Drosophila willistoni]